MEITSLNNDYIKELVKLKERKNRKEQGVFLVEGEHLVEEAYKKGILKELVLLIGSDYKLDVKTTYVTREIINKITNLENSPNIIGVCSITNDNVITGDKILLLDRIQDPGNLGTIIRSSKAFNIDTIVISKDSVDLYNPKVLRATEGIIFHINIVVEDLNIAIDNIKSNNIPLYGTKVDNGESIKSITDKSKYAIIMGNEGQGVNQELLDKCDKYLYIDMNKEVESLNVGVATSIILYEFNNK